MGYRWYQDSRGNASAGRIGFMFSLVVGAGIAVYGLIKGADLGDLALLAGIFVGGAFGGKGLQRFAERTQDGPPQAGEP